MISVIADDFTGAAEIAAVSWRFHCTSQVVVSAESLPESDVVCLDTDSRSLSGRKAADLLSPIAKQFVQTDGHIYKKVDSVLRGPVLAELTAVARTLGKQRILLAPANPGLGRTIEHGRYFIHGVEVSRTDFGRDPQHPLRSSEVCSMLEDTLSDQWPVRVIAPGRPLPPRGVFIGEAASSQDLREWARMLEPDTLPAGAAEFFMALMEQWHPVADAAPALPSDPAEESGPTLVLSGSSSEYSRKLSSDCEAAGIPVCRIPSSFSESADVEATAKVWADSVLKAFENSRVVRASLDLSLMSDPRIPPLLTRHLSALLERLLFSLQIENLCVEGGATVSRLVREFDWAPLPVLAELSPGVVLLRPSAENPSRITTKPGSYAWPGHFLEGLGIRPKQQPG